MSDQDDARIRERFAREGYGFALPDLAGVADLGDVSWTQLERLILGPPRKPDDPPPAAARAQDDDA